MPKYNFHMGVTLRCYGSVEIQADTVEAAMALMTADYLSEHITIHETTTDSGQDLAVIDITDAETGEDIEAYPGHPLPSPYDPPERPAVPSHPVAAAREAVKSLQHARDCLKAADAPRAADKVRLALSSAKGAVRHAEGKAVRS